MAKGTCLARLAGAVASRRVGSNSLGMRSQGSRGEGESVTDCSSTGEVGSSSVTLLLKQATIRWPSIIHVLAENLVNKD
jgi:hypothetical protein